MKNSNAGDFSQGSVSRAILRIGLPIMAAELVHVLYNLVDRMFISYMPEVGTLALTGVGVAFPLITIITAFANLCGTGGASLTSIARGEGNVEKARLIEETAFTMLLIMGGVLTGVMYTFAPALLELLGGEAQTLPYAVAYFRIYVLGSVPVLISLGMNPFINAQGFAKTGMLTVVIGAVLNTVLDPLMIYTMDMGVQGAALATIISQAVSALWVVAFLCGKRPILPIRRLRIHMPSMRAILKLGATGFTFKCTNSLTQAIVNMTLKSFGGTMSTLYVGAMSVINSLREVAQLPTTGITNGAAPVMSFNYGAGKPKRVSRAISFMLMGTLAMNCAMWALVMLIPERVIGIMTPDPEIIRLGARCARIYFGAFPFMSLQMTGQNTFVALNHPRYALFFSLFRKFVLVTSLTLLLPRIGFGAEGVFWAEFVSQVVGASACMLTMYRSIWSRLRAAADG